MEEEREGNEWYQEKEGEVGNGNKEEIGRRKGKYVVEEKAWVSDEAEWYLCSLYGQKVRDQLVKGGNELEGWSELEDWRS